MANGFLYDVKAIVDKASFAEGIRELQKLEQTSKRLIAGISGISASVVGSATIAGEVATQELRVARSIGVSTEALSSWKVAANVAGVSASGLIGTLSALENKMQHLKTGTVDSALAKNLGMLGVSYGDFANMDSESRMRTVFNQADQMEDQQLAATLVGDILGQAGKDYYDSLKLSGKSIDEQLQEARKLNFVSNQNRKEAALFASEIRSVKEAGKSITMLFGTEIASALTPTVKTVKNYLINNRDAIRRGITGFAQQTAGLFNAITGGLMKVVPVVNGLIDNFGGLDKVIVKVGIGFASLKLTQFAGGIRSIISGVGLLKAGLGGLALGGISLILDDIVTHFMGGESMIFDHILPKLKELKDEFNISIDTEQFKEMALSFKDLWENTEGFRKALAKIGEVLIADTINNITKAIDGLSTSLTWTMNLINAFYEGGFSGGMEFIKKTIVESATDGKPSKVVQGANATLQLVSPGAYIGGKFGEFLGNKISGKADDSANDAIVSPSGKVTKLSPDDWVFAVKDIADLAGGLMPSGVTTTNNNMSAPANYVINQSFTFGGSARASDVRAQAYRGASEALQSNLSNASRIMQLMPGTR